MRKKAPVQAFAVCFLALAAAVAAVICMELAFPWKTDFSARRTHRLSSETTDYLANLGEPVHLTFVVTARDKMPSRFKRVEKGVVSVLREMRDAAPEWVEFEVVDPSYSDAMVRFAAEKKVSQYHVDDITDDSRSEKVVWSSLVISRGDARDAIIHGVTEEYIPNLEQLIVGHLRNIKNPVKPVIGLSAPEGYGQFEKTLSEDGGVVRVDLSEELPEGLDVLYVIEPPEVGPEAIFRLRRFIESGRSVILADSLYRVGAGLAGDGSLEAVVRPAETGSQDILNAFGLSFEEEVLMDEKCEFYTLPDRKEPEAFPFAVKSNPTAFNLKNFAGSLSGNLGFMGASVISHDAFSLRSAGYDIQTVVTSSDRVWTLPLGEMRLSGAEMSPTIYKPKQPLIVQLKNRDPFFGRLLVIGSPSMFSDGGISKAGFGHRPFIKLLGRTFLSSGALVKMRVNRHLPALSPVMTPDGAVFWRVVVIFLLPACALVVMLLKIAGAPFAGMKFNPRRVVFVPAAIAASIAMVAVMGNITGGYRLDFTKEKLNSLSVATAQKVAKINKDIKIELYASDRADMPAAMKQVQAKTLGAVRELVRRSGGKIKLERVSVEGFGEVDRAALAAKGIAPRQVETTEFDIPVTKEVWHGMRVIGGGAETVVPFISPGNASSLEFYLISALDTLERGRQVEVSMASDMPRLSPAEAYEDYFKNQLSAPIGSDVYSDARRALEEYNYRVTYVNPKSGVVPKNTDLFIWMQPRRPVEDMAVAMGNYLAAGGSAFVALQHFNIQQRQYSGRGFQTVYWPQPQYMDLNNYLGLIGAEVPREVFMDEVQSAMDLEMQINRLAVREYEEQAVSRPFLIRSIPPNYSKASPVTKRLGDLMFVWGNRLLLNEDKLAELGIGAQALVSSSPRSWSYVWSGGFLGEEVFSERKYFDGGRPLAALLTGSFPPVFLYMPPPEIGADGQAVSSGQPEIRVATRPAERPAGSSGALMLVGCSEMFKNQHLYESGFYHKDFLLKAVTYMTMGAEAVELLSKEYIPRGFQRPGPGAVVKARALVVGGPAAAMLLFGIAWFVFRSRKKTVV